MVVSIISNSYLNLMLGKKFNPYGQFPANNQVYEEDEYEEEESEPMVEEIDENYEPTDREIR